jgi:hypothetical protein
VIVNGITLASEDFNDNTAHDGINVVEMLITEIGEAAATCGDKEIEASPFKKTQNLVSDGGAEAEGELGEVSDVMDLWCYRTNLALNDKHSELIAKLARVEGELASERCKTLEQEKELSSLEVFNNELYEERDGWKLKFEKSEGDLIEVRKAKEGRD